MPKKIITDEMRAAVVKIIENEGKVSTSGESTKKLSAEEIRTRVALILKFNKEKGPSLRRIQTLLKEMRTNKKVVEQDHAEAAWSLGALNQYELPFETIPCIQLIQSVYFRCNETLSIREAKWISRLYAFMGKHTNHKSIEDKSIEDKTCELEFGDCKPKDIAWCANLAKKYAFAEQNSKIMDIPFDSRELDNQILDEVIIQDCIKYFPAMVEKATVNRMEGAVNP